MYDFPTSGSSGIFGAVGTGVIILYVLVIVVNLVAMWKIFEKAGHPGWAAIVPIYNLVILLKIVNKPILWLFLLLIPFVNIYILIKVTHRLSLSFGKTLGFTLGLLLLPPVFYAVLGFDKSEYNMLPDEA